MRILGLLILRESTWLARERELQRAHVEATKRLLADLPLDVQTVSRQLHWAVLGIPADPPIDLLAEAAELLRVKWPADGAIVDRDPGDETEAP